MYSFEDRDLNVQKKLYKGSALKQCLILLQNHLL